MQNYHLRVFYNFVIFPLLNIVLKSFVRTLKTVNLPALRTSLEILSPPVARLFFIYFNDTSVILLLLRYIVLLTSPRLLAPYLHSHFPPPLLPMFWSKGYLNLLLEYLKFNPIKLFDAQTIKNSILSKKSNEHQAFTSRNAFETKNHHNKHFMLQKQTRKSLLANINYSFLGMLSMLFCDSRLLFHEFPSCDNA